MKKIIGRINFSNSFDKQLKKAPLKIKIVFKKRLELFLKEPFHPQLRNHPLLGKLSNYRSINITGDWRAIYSEYKTTKEGIVTIFEAIGTHSQLYK